MPFDLRPHQEAAIAKMHNGCILCGGVGVGKSHTAVGYYLENEAPKDVYVITTAKKRDKHDWQLLWGDVGMTSNPENTMGAVVTVDSWDNIAKYEEVENAFFIFDEQRLVGSGRWVKAFYNIAAANRWIMLSATPGDNWLDYVPVFRANGFIKNLTQFKEDHVVARWTGRYYQVVNYRQVPRLIRWRNKLLVDMPYEKHTTRHHYDVAVSYDKDLVKDLVKRRWHVYENRPLTDASELFRVMRKVVYSDESRLEALRGLLKKHPKLIVFYNFDYELAILRTLADSSSNQLQTVILDDSGRASRSKASASTESPTPSGMESTPANIQTSNPWDYLLSPEGMRANSVLSSGSTPRSESTSIQTSSPIESTSSTDTETSSSSYGIPKESPNGSSIEGMRKHSQSTSKIQTKTSDWERATGIPADHRNAPWKGESQTDSDTHPKNGLDTSSNDQTQNDSSRSKTGVEESLRDSSQSKKTARTLQMTDPGNGLSKQSGISLTKDLSSTESFRTKTDSSESQERTEQWKNLSSPVPTSRLSSSSHSTDIETISESVSKSEASQRKSISPRSSSTSRRKQDVSPTTSSSSSPPHFQVAEWNGHKHEAVPTTTSWVYLVQYVAGAEAWECTETDAICFYSMPYSWKNWHQAHGRIDRLNTSFLDLHYYVLWGGSVIEQGVRKSLKAKRSFNESAFAKVLGINSGF